MNFRSFFLPTSNSSRFNCSHEGCDLIRRIHRSYLALKAYYVLSLAHLSQSLNFRVTAVADDFLLHVGRGLGIVNRDAAMVDISGSECVVAGIEYAPGSPERRRIYI